MNRWQAGIIHIPGAGHNIRREQFTDDLQQVRLLLVEREDEGE